MFNHPKEPKKTEEQRDTATEGEEPGKRRLMEKARSKFEAAKEKSREMLEEKSKAHEGVQQSEFRDNIKRLMESSSEYYKRTSMDLSFKGQKAFFETKRRYHKSMAIGATFGCVFGSASFALLLRRYARVPGSLAGGLFLMSSAVSLMFFSWPQVEKWSTYSAKIREIEDWKEYKEE